MITGLDDPDLFTEILQAHGWDLELAISSFTSGENDNVIPQSNTSRAPVTDRGTGSDRVIQRSDSGVVAAGGAGPGLAWKLVTLPFSVISGGLGLVSGAVGLGLWAAGGILSYCLVRLGWVGGMGRVRVRCPVQRGRRWGLWRILRGSMGLDGRILLVKGLWMRCRGRGMSISCCLCTCIHRIILILCVL
ncbi:UBX domain-containing protein [Euphorbia peplus]|nr:UBX domain-containing protein [Euphorbia peplus]